MLEIKDFQKLFILKRCNIFNFILGSKPYIHFILAFGGGSEEHPNWAVLKTLWHFFFKKSCRRTFFKTTNRVHTKVTGFFLFAPRLNILFCQALCL